MRLFYVIVIAPVVRLIVLLGQFDKFSCAKSTVSPEPAEFVTMSRKLPAPLSAHVVTNHVVANASLAVNAKVAATAVASALRRAAFRGSLSGVHIAVDSHLSCYARLPDANQRAKGSCGVGTSTGKGVNATAAPLSNGVKALSARTR